MGKARRRAEAVAPAASVPGGATGAESALALHAASVAPPRIRGHDDTSREFSSLAELWAEQGARRADFYRANERWWEEGGYGGATDDETMIGDTGSAADLEHSARFLEGVLRQRPQLRALRAMDGGAGVGRVTKSVLLKCFESVELVEASPTLSRQARRYLGNKRAQRCTFVNQRLEQLPARPRAFGLVWLQWVLQYLIDEDVAALLTACAGSLVRGGVLVVKENRPAWRTKENRFELDTPSGPNERFDITRPDEHHRWLFAAAGLRELYSEHHDETTTWLLAPAGDPVASG